MSSVKVFQICYTREFNNWNIICETRSSEGEGEDARWQAAAGGAAGEVRCSRDHARNSRKAIVRDGFKKWKLCAPHPSLSDVRSDVERLRGVKSKWVNCEYGRRGIFAM